MEGSWKFIGGVAKANMILSATPTLHGALEFISNFQSSPRPISCAVGNLGRFTILAFNSGSRRQGLLPDLQSLDKSHKLLGFLITKDNPSVALDSSLLSTFHSLLERQPDLTNKVKEQASLNQSRLIVVGHSEGGALAALFTLSLLKNWSSPALPLCVTFGSPFIGNRGLQEAVSNNKQWKSQFWHVLSLDDSVVSRFSVLSSENDSAKQLNPFGTFLILSGSRYACVDDPNSVSELLLSRLSTDLQRPDSVQMETKDYGAILRQLEQGTKYRKCNIQPTAFHDSLAVDLALQLQTLEIGYNQQGLQAMEERHRSGRREPTHHSKLLNSMKKKMAQLEWFKKACETDGTNYYDFYKRSEKSERPEINVRTIKDLLVAYWKKEVEKAADKPQKRGAPMRDTHLFAGNNYRKMVEPLAIADHYKKGGKDYLKQRHPHFENLEKWEKAAAERKEEQRTAPSLTKDSCFWAHVEEAALKLRELEKGGEAKKDIRGEGLRGARVEEAALKLREFEKDGEGKKDIKGELRGFEAYVVNLVGNCQLAPDAFSDQSSFMVWWEEYSKMLNGEGPDPAQDSPFFAFMAGGGYRNYVRNIS